MQILRLFCTKQHSWKFSFNSPHNKKRCTSLMGLFSALYQFTMRWERTEEEENSPAPGGVWTHASVLQPLPSPSKNLMVRNSQLFFSRNLNLSDCSKWSSWQKWRGSKSVLSALIFAQRREAHPSKYHAGPMLLNISDQMGTGVSNMSLAEISYKKGFGVCVCV